MIYDSINAHPFPDSQLSGKRARRVVAPRFLTSGERKAWLAGCEPRSLTRITANIEDLPPPTPRPKTRPKPVSKLQLLVRAKRRRASAGPRDFIVAWRTLQDSGSSSKLTWPQAHKMAGEYERPGCWAVIIDARSYAYVKEFGTGWKGQGGGKGSE